MNALFRAMAATAALTLIAGCGRDGSGAAAPAAPAAPKLEVVTVRRGDISRSIVLPAELAAWREVTLYAKTAGYLKDWRAMSGDRRLDIGDVVTPEMLKEKDGDVLAVLNVPEMEAEVGRLEAEVAKADADTAKARADADAAAAGVREPEKERLSLNALIQKADSAVAAAQSDVRKYEADAALADATHSRYKRLVGDNTVTQLEYDVVRTKQEASSADLAAARNRLTALRDEAAYVKSRVAEIEAKIDGAKARLAAAQASTTAAEKQKNVAEARLRQAQALYDYRFIRAPFAGIVVRRYVDPGAMIQAATATQTQASPLLTISDQSQLRVLVDVPEAEVPHLSMQTRGRMTLPELPGKSFDVGVSRSSESVRPATRTQRIEMDITDPKPPLRPGLYGQVRLTMETHAGVIVVPTAAVGGKGAERFVFLLADGKAVKRPVVLGFQDGEVTEVRAAETEGGNISKGLAEGEKVLKLTSTVVLQNGQPVEATPVKY